MKDRKSQNTTTKERKKERKKERNQKIEIRYEFSIETIADRNMKE